jgi:hypothetical protein
MGKSSSYYAISPLSMASQIMDDTDSGIKDDDSWVGEKKESFSPFFGLFFFFSWRSENSLTRIDDMWGPPQRGNHKEAEGEWGKGVTSCDGGNGRKKDRGEGGQKGWETWGAWDKIYAGRVCTLEKKLGNGGRKWRRMKRENGRWRTKNVPQRVGRGYKKK